jgi:hypothetical protein
MISLSSSNSFLLLPCLGKHYCGISLHRQLGRPTGRSHPQATLSTNSTLLLSFGAQSLAVIIASPSKLVWMSVYSLCGYFPRIRQMDTSPVFSQLYILLSVVGCNSNIQQNSTCVPARPYMSDIRSLLDSEDLLDISMDSESPQGF